MKAGLSQRALGVRIGRSQSYVQLIESNSYWTGPFVGSVHKVSWVDAQKIADVLGVSVKMLFPDEDGRTNRRLGHVPADGQRDLAPPFGTYWNSARGHSDQSWRIANFLLDWWPSLRSSFNVNQMGGHDRVVQDDVMKVFLFIVRDNGCPDGQGFDDDFRALLECWRAETTSGLTWRTLQEFLD